MNATTVFSGTTLRIVAGVLCVALFVGTIGIALPERANAQQIVHDPKAAAQRVPLITNSTVQSGLLGSLNKKEFVLDGIFNTLAKNLIRAFSRSIIQWINSGFKGKPAFVTDLKKFLLNVLDQTAGEFLLGSELGFLCRPGNIRLALLDFYRNSTSFGRQAQCTLTGAIANAQRAVQGAQITIGGGGTNFNSISQIGGIPGWFNMILNPQNNPYGEYAIAKAELQNRLAEAKSRETTKLNWGKGFLSQEKCSAPKKVGQFTEQECSITSPGHVIAGTLMQQLNNPQLELIMADEINEILSALFYQLTLRALAGVGGVLGLSQGTATSPSFLDQVGKQVLDSSAQFSSTTASLIDVALYDEAQYFYAFQDLMEDVEDIEDIASSSPSSCEAVEDLEDDLQTLKTPLLREYSSAVANLNYLVQLKARAASSTSDVERITLIQEFETFRANGRLHDASALALTNTTRSEARTALQTLKGQMRDAKEECED